MVIKLEINNYDQYNGLSGVFINDMINLVII